jgi:hypothetical protein
VGRRNIAFLYHLFGVREWLLADGSDPVGHYVAVQRLRSFLHRRFFNQFYGNGCRRLQRYGYRFCRHQRNGFPKRFLLVYGADLHQLQPRRAPVRAIRQWKLLLWRSFVLVHAANRLSENGRLLPKLLWMFSQLF